MHLPHAVHLHPRCAADSVCAPCVWRRYEPGLASRPCLGAPAARHRETHKSEGHKAAQDAALAAARGDAAVLAEVAGDARLYDAAIALFERQIADA